MARWPKPRRRGNHCRKPHESREASTTRDSGSISASPSRSAISTADPAEAARAFGIDISLLRSNLARTPEERVRIAGENADLVRAIRGQAGRSGLLSKVEAVRGAEIRFVVVGELAAAAHGSARVPSRLEIVLDRAPDNLERLSAFTTSPDEPADVDPLDRVEGIGDYTESG